METNAQMWNIVKEIDDFIKDNSVSDWELDFISDMMDRRHSKRSYSPKQSAIILRIWEKYCA
jgi:hypothetical protein